MKWDEQNLGIHILFKILLTVHMSHDFVQKKKDKNNKLESSPKRAYYKEYIIVFKLIEFINKS